MPLNQADLQAIGALIAGATPTPKPWWRRIDGIGVVFAAAISVVTLGTLFLTASGQTAAIQRLDDRLTPAIEKLSEKIGALEAALSGGASSEASAPSA